VEDKTRFNSSNASWHLSSQINLFLFSVKVYKGLAKEENPFINFR